MSEDMRDRYLEEAHYGEALWKRLMYGEWVTEKKEDMPVETRWNTTGYVQIGTSRFLVETIVECDITVPSIPDWNEEIWGQRSITVEGMCEMTDAGREFFDALRHQSSFEMSMFRPRSLSISYVVPSKQTNEYHRIRARDRERRKVVVHAHRRHRGKARE